MATKCKTVVQTGDVGHDGHPFWLVHFHHVINILNIGWCGREREEERKNKEEGSGRDGESEDGREG